MNQFSEIGDVGVSVDPTQTLEAGTWNQSRWSVLALVVNFVVKLRLLLKERYMNQEMMKLHCHLFPSDYVFERETLIELWMAAGYLRKRQMEDYGRRYWNILLEKGFIVVSTEDDTVAGKCKYITNVGEVANGLNGISKFKDVDLLSILKKEHMEEAKGTKPWHVSLASNDINEATFETLKRFDELRTLLFITNYGSSLRQVPSDLFLALPCLEALDLSGSHITELPGSIGNVGQLRYLNLSYTLIESLPETISRLQELQTLNLEGCKRLYSLPKGFKNLFNLRHLHFDVLSQLKFMPREIGALTELRTLSAFIVDAEKGCNIEELRFMNNLSGSLCISGLENMTSNGVKKAALNNKHLSRLQLRWNEYGVVDDQLFCAEAMSHLQPNPCLEELQLLYYPYAKLPEWIHAEKFTRLSCITLRRCKVSILDVQLGQLPSLKSLNLIQMDEIGLIDLSMHCKTKYSFPKLEKLTIEGMLRLFAWVEVENGHFPMLTEFIIKDCPNLKSLPFLPVLGSLKLLEISECAMLDSLSIQKLPDKLETLLIEDCPLLIKNYAGKGAEWDSIKHVPHIWFDFEEIQSLPASTARMKDVDAEPYLSKGYDFEEIQSLPASTAPMKDVKYEMEVSNILNVSDLKRQDAMLRRPESKWEVRLRDLQRKAKQLSDSDESKLDRWLRERKQISSKLDKHEIKDPSPVQDQERVVMTDNNYGMLFKRVFWVFCQILGYILRQTYLCFRAFAICFVLFSFVNYLSSSSLFSDVGLSVSLTIMSASFLAYILRRLYSITMLVVEKPEINTLSLPALRVSFKKNKGRSDHLSSPTSSA